MLLPMETVKSAVSLSTDGTISVFQIPAAYLAQNSGPSGKNMLSKQIATHPLPPLNHIYQTAFWRQFVVLVS